MSSSGRRRSEVGKIQKTSECSLGSEAERFDVFARFAHAAQIVVLAKQSQDKHQNESVELGN